MGKKDLLTERDKAEIKGQFDKYRPLRNVKDNRIQEMLARKEAQEAVRKYNNNKTYYKLNQTLEKEMKEVQKQLEKKSNVKAN